MITPFSVADSWYQVLKLSNIYYENIFNYNRFSITELIKVDAVNAEMNGVYRVQDLMMKEVFMVPESLGRLINKAV